jgi:hypothetical protein
MKPFSNASAKAPKELRLLVVTIFIVFLVELLLFNRGFIIDRLYGLKEQRYSIHDGTLHQMDLKNGKLVSLGSDPNITFKNINMPVDRISIMCKNTKARERAQVFFRTANERFSESNSIIYKASTSSNTQIINLPAIQMVSALRLDLTTSENDVIKCREFVINPAIPFNVRFRRVAVYIVFILIATFEFVSKLSARVENPEELFPSLAFQRLATPLLAVCLVFPDVVFLGTSLRITDQVYGSRSNFPSIAFYPHYPHHQWNASRGDYIAAVYQSEPMMEYMARSLREGESPYWNPYSAAGSLGPETLVDNKFSVFTMVYAFLGGGQKTFNLVFLSIYFLAAYSTFGLLREKLRLSFLASLAGTIFFLLNGFATANIGSNVTQNYLFVPLCLYTSFSLIEKPTAYRIAAVVLSFAAFFSYTFIPTTLTGFAGLYAVLLGYAIMLYRKFHSNSRWLLRMLSAHAICVGMSILLLAFIYFPIVENLSSTDTVNVYSARDFKSLSWLMIPSVFSSSHFFESYQAMEAGARDYAAQRNKSMLVFHLGTTVFILAVCSISLKRRDFAPLVLICMIVILIGFGRLFNVPGISSLISKTPVISYMIAPQYWWPIIVIPLIPLVAIGVDNLQNRFVTPISPMFVLAILVGSLVAVWIVYGLREPNVWYKQWSIALLLATAIVCSVAIAASAYTSRNRLRNYVASALVMLAFVELTMDSKTMRYISADLFTDLPAEITFIKKHIGLYRTLTIGFDFGVRHELGSAFGIQEVTSINLGTLSNYMDYFHNMVSLDKSQRLFYDYYPSLRSMQDTPDKNTLNWAAIDLLGIKYIIAPTGFSQYRQVFLEHGLIPVLDAGTVYVYQNPNVMPRAFIVEVDEGLENSTTLSNDILSKLEPADITLYRNSEVILTGTARQPSLLILTDNWHPNWQAFVNDVPAEVILVNGTFRGVPVPAGPYQVRFYYQPRSLSLAFFTSGTILLLLVYIILDYKRIDRFLNTRVAHPRLGFEDSVGFERFSALWK